MKIRVLLATPHSDFVALMQNVLDSALKLVKLDVNMEAVNSKEALFGRSTQEMDDVILLDWDIDRSRTPELVRELLALNPKLRVVAMLPLTHRQYRQKVWDAGACNGIPKEHVDQEWMATVLCIMQRAMEREARLLQNA